MGRTEYPRSNVNGLRNWALRDLANGNEIDLF